MDKLKSLQCSVSKSDNRSNILTRYIWKFYDSNNVLKNLEYQHSIYYINTLNKKTRVREDIEHITEKYTLSSNDKKSIYEQINNIDEWLTNNLEYLTKSHDNCMKSFQIIEYLKLELGDYDFATTYEVGWSIKDFYKLYIDLYSTNITLNYKNKETKLSEQKLKTFIQKNKKLIIQAKENQEKKYIHRINETKEQERLKKLTEETEKLVIDKYQHDATRKVGTRKISSGFSIHRTLKERYETQACKPFPVKYPWEKTNKY
jgi:hypothetical protein